MLHVPSKLFTNWQNPSVIDPLMSTPWSGNYPAKFKILGRSDGSVLTAWTQYLPSIPQTVAPIKGVTYNTSTGQVNIDPSVTPTRVASGNVINLTGLW